jgi:hypothetical protein
MNRTKLKMNWEKEETGEKYFYKNNAMQSRRSGGKRMKLKVNFVAKDFCRFRQGTDYTALNPQ